MEQNVVENAMKGTKDDKHSNTQYLIISSHEYHVLLKMHYSL